MKLDLKKILSLKNRALFKRTKIITTIGPSSQSQDKLQAIFQGGGNICRLNFSHSDHPHHQKIFNEIDSLRSKKRFSSIATLLDTKGPEIRTGLLEQKQLFLKKGQALEVTTKEIMGNDKVISISYQDLLESVKPGKRILVADGNLTLQVESIDR